MLWPLGLFLLGVIAAGVGVVGSLGLAWHWRAMETQSKKEPDHSARPRGQRLIIWIGGRLDQWPEIVSFVALAAGGILGLVFLYVLLDQASSAAVPS